MRDGDAPAVAQRIKELVAREEGMSVLVGRRHIRGELRPVTLELISAARSLGGPVAVAVIAKDPGALTDTVNVEGVDEILTVQVEQDEFENDVYQAAVEQLVAERSPRAVLLGFTVGSMGYGPALAAKLGLGFASDVFAVREEDGGLVAERSFYGAKVNGELEFPGHDTVVLLLRPTSWQPAEGAGSASVTAVEAPSATSRARHKDWVEAQAGDVDITHSRTSCSRSGAGRRQGNLEQFEELAESMGATLSSSRPLGGCRLDAERRPGRPVRQAVKPKVYLAAASPARSSPSPG